MFSVSIDSKELSDFLTRLNAILTGRPVNVASKEVIGTEIAAKDGPLGVLRASDLDLEEALKSKNASRYAGATSRRRNLTRN
jgi:hypothetical protein